MRIITFASVTDCLKTKHFIHECLLYTENDLSKTSNSSNSLNVNFTIILSVLSRVTHTDTQNWARPDRLSKEQSVPDPTQPKPTRPVDGPDPCPILAWLLGLATLKLEANVGEHQIETNGIARFPSDSTAFLLLNLRAHVNYRHWSWTGGFQPSSLIAWGMVAKHPVCMYKPRFYREMHICVYLCTKDMELLTSSHSAISNSRFF